MDCDIYFPAVCVLVSRMFSLCAVDGVNDMLRSYSAPSARNSQRWKPRARWRLLCTTQYIYVRTKTTRCYRNNIFVTATGWGDVELRLPPQSYFLNVWFLYSYSSLANNIYIFNYRTTHTFYPFVAMCNAVDTQEISYRLCYSSYKLLFPFTGLTSALSLEVNFF